MFNWMAQRAMEIFFAFVIVALLLWLILTMPVVGLVSPVKPLQLNTENINKTMQDLATFRGEMVPDTAEEQESAVTRAADYLITQFNPLGVLESQGYSPSLQMIRVTLGKQQEHVDLSIVVHHVIAPSVSWEGAKALAGLLEVIRQFKPAKNSTLEVVVYLHQVDQLAATVRQAGRTHVETILRNNTKPKRILVWMPGILLPETSSKASMWDFLALAAPDPDGEAAFYSRIEDYKWLRSSKGYFKAADIPSVASLSVPSSFPKVLRFPLTAYWERDIPAILLTTNLVGAENNYPDLMRLMTGLNLIIKQAMLPS